MRWNREGYCSGEAWLSLQNGKSTSGEGGEIENVSEKDEKAAGPWSVQLL
jgi:hypothetical protein